MMNRYVTPKRSAGRAASVAAFALSSLLACSTPAIAKDSHGSHGAHDSYGGKSGMDASGTMGAPISHNKVKSIVWKCADRERDASAFAQSRAMQPNDPQTLLFTAIKGKPTPNEPVASLGWMDMNLRMYGNSVPLTTLQGEPRKFMVQLATLVHNDYIIAAKMAMNIAMQSPEWPRQQGVFVARLIDGLTEPSHDVPDIARTNAKIEQSFSMIEGLQPALRGYAKWAIRGFAYDDDVAIDASMAGMCLAKPTPTEKTIVEKAIRVSQFKP